jgi:hypothetical protein
VCKRVSVGECVSIRGNGYIGVCIRCPIKNTHIHTHIHTHTHTHSIWGLIYIALGAFCVFQTIHKDQPVVRRVDYWFAINGVLNVLWIFVFCLEWYVHPHTHMYIRMLTHSLTHTLTNVYVNTHKYINMMYMFIYTHMHIHTHAHTGSRCP